MGMGEGMPLFYEVNLVEHFVKSGDIWRKGWRSQLKIQSPAATAAERKSRFSSSFLNVQWVGTALDSSPKIYWVPKRGGGVIWGFGLHWRETSAQ